MPQHQQARHAITLALPVRPCQMLFTPAGEELWVEGWQPRYHHPPDGRTCEGMVFATGTDDELTLWSLIDFERGPARYRARYSRVTPALRSGLVEVVCEPLSDAATRVQVRYEMTALTPAGEASLQAYEPEPFARMIEGWRARIEALLPALAEARIR